MYAPRTKITGVGVFIRAIDTGRYLFLMRTDEKFSGCWALAGGRVEENETLLDALSRECSEEIGIVPQFLRLAPVEQFTSPDGRFAYHTFFGSVTNEFIPQLNEEHSGFAWTQRGSWPKPLHPGLWSTLQFVEVQTKLKQLEEIS